MVRRQKEKVEGTYLKESEPRSAEEYKIHSIVKRTVRSLQKL
jgi:hypothetical protein